MVYSRKDQRPYSRYGHDSTCRSRYPFRSSGRMDHDPDCRTSGNERRVADGHSGLVGESSTGRRKRRLGDNVANGRHVSEARLGSMVEPSESRDSGDDVRLRLAIESGGELLGAVGGGAVGLLGGPAGAMLGAASGVALTRAFKRVGVEVYERLIVSRQQQRVGAALAVVVHDTKSLAAGGASWREDGFFEADEGRRSDAEELLEGVLLQAADAYQEMKLRHLGAIVPALATRPDVSAMDGHWITDLASRLTWRQLVVLAIFIDPPEEVLVRHSIDQDVSGRGRPPGTLSDEVRELGGLGLLGIKNPDGEVVRMGDTYEGSGDGIWHVGMERWSLTTTGRLLSELTRLDDVSGAEHESVLRQLLS
jgi:hypothetical protein